MTRGATAPSTDLRVIPAERIQQAIHRDIEHVEYFDEVCSRAIPRIGYVDGAVIGGVDHHQPDLVRSIRRDPVERSDMCGGHAHHEIETAEIVRGYPSRPVRRHGYPSPTQFRKRTGIGWIAQL